MHKTALLFAGQGAQTVGMGKALADVSRLIKTCFEQANSILGYDLTSLCLNGPEAELTKTEHAQPGIFLVGWAAYEALRERLPSLRFEATAGLSLGEWTALSAAGAFSFADGLRLVRQRGQFMQEACETTRGTMAAIIGLSADITRAVCVEAGIELANLNCPGQLVVSGELEKVQRACELAKSRGAKKAMPLTVAGAYHSRLMADAQSKLAVALNSITIQTPTIPVISNVTAQPHGAVDSIRSRLVEQVTSPVDWEGSMRYLLAQGFNRFIELGPGKVLCGFMKRIDSQAQLFNVADAESLEKTVHGLTTNA